MKYFGSYIVAVWLMANGNPVTLLLFWPWWAVSSSHEEGYSLDHSTTPMTEVATWISLRYYLFKYQDRNTNKEILLVQTGTLM